MKRARFLTLIALAVPAFGQYAGPAILSRGEAPAAMNAPRIDFRPYLEVTAVYDTGLSGVAVVNAKGDLGDETAEGINVTWGVSGVHSWQHTRLGVDYRGSLRDYSKATYFDNSDQSLAFSVMHQFTRHVSLILRETAGMFERDFGLVGLPQTAGYDPNSNLIPTTDFYDNRTMYFNTQADLTFQKTARLSFSFGGGGFAVFRRSSALYGMMGETAHGDVQYRLSRRSTLGAMYAYNRFVYSRILGGTDMHSAAITYAAALSRWWELSGYAGFARVENLFVQTVPLDPTVSALLGGATGLRIAYNVVYIPNANLRLSRTFSKGVAYAAAGRSVIPGNGLFLTSSATQIMGGYTFTGVRRWSFGLTANDSRANSLGNVVGGYNTLSAGFTVSRQIIRTVHGLVSVSARRYSSPTFSQYNRPIFDISVGLGFTPGDVPLRIW